ncbi:S-adenosyl-L-methionine-dependent methyltransferase [Aspergillus egyptiacus]|nr:S-adenosyl-L-methionine-dependent methyltransferase [Aspergillus egyptiacus]
MTSAPQPGTAGAAFDKSSDVYERMTGGCTREVAKFLLTLSPQVDSSSVILDNACGTGIVVEEILSQFPDAKPTIFAADVAPNMIAKFKDKAIRKGWMNEDDGHEHEPTLTLSVTSAEELPYPANTFTHSYTNLGFPFFQDSAKAAAQVHRTLRPGGTAFVSTWMTLGYLAPVHKAQRAVRPNDPVWEPPMPKDWCTKEKLEAVLQAGGFQTGNIQIRAKTVRYGGEGLEDFLDIMTSAFGGYVTKDWSEGEKTQWVKELRESLTEEEREGAGVEMVAWVAVARK